MKLGKDELLAALRLRYDHYSTQSIFETARKHAGLDDRPTYDDAEVDAFRAALARVGDRLELVNRRLDSLRGDAAPAKPELVIVKVEPEPEPVIVKSGPVIVKAESRPEPVIVKPEPKSESRPDAKSGPVLVKSEPKLEPVIVKSESAKSAAIATRIVLSGIEVADGEHILLCGELAELGNWDPDRARPMTRDGDRWSATLELQPGTTGSFKFLRRAPDGTIHWEAGEDRGLQAVPRIEATWQS